MLVEAFVKDGKRADIFAKTMEQPAQLSVGRKPLGTVSLERRSTYSSE